MTFKRSLIGFAVGSVHYKRWLLSRVALRCSTYASSGRKSTVAPMLAVWVRMSVACAHAMRIRLCITLLFCVCISVEASDTKDLRPFPRRLPSRFGVVGVNAHAVNDTLHVDKVRRRSPAAHAGLRVGDRLLGASGVRLKSATQLSLFVQSFAPGDSLTFSVLRADQRLDLACRVTDRKQLYAMMVEAGDREPSLATRHQGWLTSSGPAETRAQHLIEQLQAQRVVDTLTAALAVELTRYGADGRLADVNFLLRNPLKTPAAASAISQSFAAGLPLKDHLLAVAAHLDLELTYVPPQGPSGSLEELLLAPVEEAAAQVELAFSTLSSAEHIELRAGIEPLLQRFDESILLDEGDSDETEGHMQTVRLAKRVDMVALLQAALSLSPLTENRTADRIRSAAARLQRTTEGLPAAFEGQFLYAEQTPWGWFVVGDTTANVYGGPAAVILDLGGDDIYLAGPGAADRASVALVLDLGGNDRYVGNRLGSLGAGRMAVGLLVDRAGDDLYVGDTLTQGAAFCGVGILWDAGGNDTYLAQHSAQGAAYFGAGLLVDRKGDDLFSLGQYGQGFGGAHGIGALLDGDGKDHLAADLKVPSSYGTAGVYSAWSQGVGMGFRGMAPGGLGLLMSAGDGDDTYQAGDFSQGTGYFFGLGILTDTGGDDRYLGSRYSQGTAAHQALGVLLDDAGNDHYQSNQAASQGAAWDASVAVLMDRSGNDSYAGGDLAQGAAAMNGVGWLYDVAGDDSYQTRSGQADGGSTQYWGGRGALNLGLLLDEQGQDTYSRADRKDSTAIRDSRVGLFLDGTRDGPSRPD
jgi:hypothetical protein